MILFYLFIFWIWLVIFKAIDFILFSVFNLLIILIIRYNSAGSIQSEECGCEPGLPRELLVRVVHDLRQFRPET